MVKSGWTVIFDLDGTLIPHTSAEKTLFFYLMQKRIFSIANILQLLPAIWTTRGNFHEMTLTNKRYLRNKSAVKFQEIARKYFTPRIDTLIYPLMQNIIEMHRQNGDKLLLLTGTLDFIAECFSRHLSFDGYRATELEIKGGKFTGKVIGIQPFGIGKLEVLRELKDKFHFDRDKTILYANIYSDRYVMNAVEKPVAVNADNRLLKYAIRSKWRVLDPDPKKVCILNTRNYFRIR